MIHLVYLIPLALLFAASPTSAQDRSTSPRSRLELSFDHGFGFGSEGSFVELAMDARIYAPSGVGVVLRTGIATQGLSQGIGFDPGIAFRVNLVAQEHAGLQLAGAIGPSAVWGPFDAGEVWAFGGWAMAHLDAWYQNFFVGVGVSGHLLLSERTGQSPVRYAEAPRTDPIRTLTPMLRVGGEWGL